MLNRTCRRLKYTNLAIFDGVVDRLHEFILYFIGLIRVMEVSARRLHCRTVACIDSITIRDYGQYSPKDAFLVVSGRLGS